MAKARAPKRINLALQGGGAHGAFTWGVLDRLLECEDVEIAAVSGTSAGALNAAALASGYCQNGRDGAKAALERVWTTMGGITDMRINDWMTEFGPTTQIAAAIMRANPAFEAMDIWAAMSTPYVYGPLYQNPLQAVVDELDLDDLEPGQGPAVFISTTNVRTGKIRVFAGEEVSTQVILASACLPEMFQAIDITDPITGVTDPYWDGGYTGNPALFPLFEPEFPADVVIVNINPLEREGTPKTPEEIQNRINEISFNSSMLRELRAIQFVRDLIAEERLPTGSMKDVLIHMIADDDLMQSLSARTKLVPSPFLISRMRTAGHAAADRFLEAHFDDLGERASVDLKTMFS